MITHCSILEQHNLLQHNLLAICTLKNLMIFDMMKKPRLLYRVPWDELFNEELCVVSNVSWNFFNQNGYCQIAVNCNSSIGIIQVSNLNSNELISFKRHKVFRVASSVLKLHWINCDVYYFLLYRY
jgi:hypothetical protein